METILNRWSGKWKLLNRACGFGYIQFLDDYYHICGNHHLSGNATRPSQAHFNT